MEFLIYFIQVNISLVVLYLIYRVFLKNLTFYTLNRYYFLISIFFSVSFPLIDWKSLLQARQTFVQPVFDENHIHQISINPLSQIIPYLNYFFAGVMIILGIKFLIRLISIFYIHFHSKSANWKNIDYRHVFKKINPFSFWKSIYIHAEEHPEKEMENILLHENIHVKQKHTLDVVFLEIVCILNWFNPFVWQLRKSVHQNLEYLTDQLVLQMGIDKKSYQLSLIRVQQEMPVSSLGNSFSIGMLKSRIQMMNRQKSSFIQVFKYFLTVPSAMLIALTLTIGKASQNKDIQVIIQDLSLEFNNNDTQKSAALIESQVEAESPVLIRIESPPPIPPSVDEVSMPNYWVISDQVNESLKSLNKPYVEDFNFDSEHVKYLSENNPKAVKVVVGKPMVPQKIRFTGVYVDGNKAESSDELKAVKIFVDGKKVDNLNLVKAESIESITVYKNSDGKVEEYGEAPKGLILITSKK